MNNRAGHKRKLQIKTPATKSTVDRLTNESVRSIWFTDEETFTLATPVNSQNDRVYSEARKKNQVPATTLIYRRT